MNILEQAAAEGVTGFLHPDELTKLMELAEGREVCEIGSYKGLSAWGMAQTAVNVVCVDTFKATDNGQEQREEFTTLDAFKKATARFSTVEIYPMTSEAADLALKRRTFDMVFLDAMHDYENVKADILRWYPRVRVGGVLALHDYGHWNYPGVMEAVHETIGKIHWRNRIHSLGWKWKK